MYTVSLERMQFSGAHGLHPEERVIGHSFEVDVHLVLGEDHAIRHLKETVDYEKVYTMVRSIMAVRRDLLEELAEEISSSLKSRFPLILSSDVLVRKCNPPLAGPVAGAAIRLQKKYEAIH